MRRTRMRGALTRARSTLACSFHWGTFCLNRHDGPLDHAEESLLNSLSAYVASAVTAAATSSRDLVDFIDVDDTHAMIM